MSGASFFILFFSFLFFVFCFFFFFFFSSRRRHTRCLSDWSSDVCSSDLTSLNYCVQRLQFPLDRSSKRRIRMGSMIRTMCRLQRARFVTSRKRFSGFRSEERRVGKERRERGGKETEERR